MKRNKQLAMNFTVALAVTALTGASAFAESRPRNETHSRGGGHGAIQRSAPEAHSQANRGNGSRNDSNGRRSEVGRSSPQGNRDEVRTPDRNGSRSRIDVRQRDDARVDSSRGDTRNSGRSGINDRSRGNNRGDGNWNNRSGGSRNNDGWRGGSHGGYSGRGSYGNRQHYYAHGRISRINRYGGGFRIWVVGAPYPFFVPEAYYYRNHFRVGISIGLGGYYNPLGYYDYYDGYDNGYYSGRSYSAGDLRGVVESVDYRRGTFVIRNEASGSFVTVEMRDRDEDIRPGDYVEASGDWTRSGYFVAYGVDRIDDSYRR